jgi:hypothetical protein
MNGWHQPLPRPFEDSGFEEATDPRGKRLKTPATRDDGWHKPGSRSTRRSRSQPVTAVDSFR